MSRSTLKEWLSATFISTAKAERNLSKSLYVHSKTLNDKTLEKEQYWHELNLNLKKIDTLSGWVSVQQSHQRSLSIAADREKLKKIQDEKNLIEGLIRKYAHGAYEISVIDLLNEVNELDEKCEKIVADLDESES